MCCRKNIKSVFVPNLVSVALQHEVESYDKVGIGPHAYLIIPNDKINLKGNAAIEEHLSIHTDNHAYVIGRFVSDIIEKDKPKGYDHDAIIEKDVWIGLMLQSWPGFMSGAVLPQQ